MKHTLTHRLLSLLLCATLLLGLVPTAIVSAAAGDTGLVSTVQGTKVADPHNIHGWTHHFGSTVLNTENAGKVWADKSVFTDVASFKAAMLQGESINPNAAYNSMAIDDDNFLVALSGIAATKEVVGYSAVPTDTVFVLDVSESMDQSGYVPSMVTAANNAIKTLLELNRHNRVSVVLYSGNTREGSSNLSHATVLLPLDRYEAGNSGDYVTYTGYTTSTTVAVARDLKNGEGEEVDRTSKTTQGGTYIQSGLYLASTQFKKAYDDGTTVIDSDLIQGGTKRIPVVALMSDGLPTAASTNYATLGTNGTSNQGDGTENTNAITFLTQLTAKWLKESASKYYGNEALFYSLWLKSANDNSNNPTIAPSTSGVTLDGWWKSYLNATAGSQVSFRVSQSRTFSITRDDVVERVPAVDPATDEYTKDWTEAQNYVDEYFTATNAGDFENAFNRIVDTIIAQSRYYPTMVSGQNHSNSGYIAIEDPIGVFMEVKELEGIDIGGHLFTGEALIKMMMNNDFGNRDTYTENGWKLIEAIENRLGVGEDVAIAIASEAWNYGQLGYDSTTGKYSNYIGWYADENGVYKGFWHDGHTVADVPAGATQRIKSYGFYGVIDDAISDSNIAGTDMMHIAVRVATKLTTGEQTVSFGIPAALIPLVVYEVEVNASSIAAATEAKLNVTGATHPLRLLMEVGLREDINELTVKSIVEKSDHYHKDADGNYVFYTNRWGDVHVDTGMMDKPEYMNHTATVSHFNPSVMNEKYYFFQDTAIYTDERGTRYVGSSAPANATFYELVYVFEATGNGDEARILKKYRPISDKAIIHAEKDEDSNAWHIPGNVAHYNVTDYKVQKPDNATDTLEYLVSIEIPEYTQGRYEVYSMHGNNGRITMSQTTGMKLTKEIPVVIPGTSTKNFVLNVAFAAPAGTTLPATVKVSYDQKTYVEVATNNVSVTLDANESVWIYGLPAGTAYTVTEEDHLDYQPQISSVSGTLTGGEITPVTFTNRAKDAGRVVITKKVAHPFGEGTVVPTNLKFAFIAAIFVNGTAYANQPVETSHGSFTTDYLGQIIFALGADDSISINGLPNGAEVQVFEVDMPQGFRADKDSDSAITTYGEVEELVFTNTYEPRSINGSQVKIHGTKYLDGRLWQDFDAYTFRLQYWNGISWQVLAGGSENVATKADPTFNLSDVFASFNFDHEGSYRFWIVEEEGELGGITYDKSVREFIVTVEDNWKGVYEIADVSSASAQVTVTETPAASGTEYTVNTGFTNRYSTGTTFVDLSGEKTLVGDDLAGYVGENGFGFELHTAVMTSGGLQQDQLIYTAHLNDEGKFTFDHNYVGHLVFDQPGTYYFIVREAVIGSDPLMKFDPALYEITVVVTDNLVGGLENTVAVTRVTAGGSTTADKASLNFTNERLPKAVQIRLLGHKNYNLTLPADKFTFDLYKATLSGSTYTAEGNALLSATNRADGAFLLEDGASSSHLVFTKAGDYHFIVKERLPAGVSAQDPTLNGITYDTREYGLTVRVTDGISPTGRAILIYELLVNGVPGGSITFDNRYGASGEITLSGEKTLDGKTQGTEAFTFELYNASVSGSTVTLGSLIDSKSPVGGTFTFKALHFASLADVGEHYFVIRERIPAGANAAHTYKGVTYDAREYLVKITVTDNGDGTLKTEKTVTLNGAPAEVRFENTYAITAETRVPVSGEKGAEDFTLKDGDFSFAIYNGNVDGQGKVTADGTPIETVKNVGSAFSFTDLKFDSLTDVGDHYFVICEVVPDEADANGIYKGILYDKSEFVLKVTVTDNGDGTLKAVPTLTKNGTAASLRFENAYRITTAGAITVGGEKKLEDKTLADGVYTFELYKAQKDGQGKLAIVGSAIDTDINKDGKFTFDTVTFTSLEDVGIHYFAVKERIPAAAQDNAHLGVLYDARTYFITVTVTDNGDGTLAVTSATSVEGESAAKIEFVNKYGVMTPVEITLEGEKTLDGAAAPDGKFTFGLYKVSVTAAGDPVIDPNALQTVSTKDGKFSFTAMKAEKLSDEGNYFFAIREIIPDGADENGVKDGIKYDPTLYYARVEVSDNGDGTFKTQVYYGDAEGKIIDHAPTFANTTVEKPPVPTGDRANLALWLALLFVSGTSLFVVPLIAKKRRA